MEEKIENAGPLFQLLLKYQLTQESVSMTIIRILESHLIMKNGEIWSASPIAGQLRAAFISEFLGNILLKKQQQPIKQCKNKKGKILLFGLLNLSFFSSFLVLKNAVCKFLLTAFIHERLSGTWPDSINNLLEILGTSPLGREIFLKFCLILTEEIASANSNVVKNEIISKRNADLRDSMRVSDNTLLCSFWRQVLQDYTSSSASDHGCAVMALECLANFSSWIDVGLVVEGETLKLIYFLLQSPQETVQLAAADCLSEIISKGMSATDKISLANYMNLTSVFEAVSQRALIDSFFSKICRVLNNLGYSLGQQINLVAPNLVQNVQNEVVQYLCPVLLPHLIRFLGLLTRQARGRRIGNDRWEEALNSLLPFIGNVFEISRSMRDHLRSDQIEFMSQFLPLCVDLLEVADDEVFDVTEGEFNEIRLSLMHAFESVLWLQGHATLAFLNSLTRAERLTLGRCELITKLTLRVPEGMRGPPSFTLSINGNSQMTPVCELVTWTIENIPDLHPELIGLVSEVLVRYSSTSYLDVFPDRIESGLRLLMRLLEARGFQIGDCELMLRYVKNLKGKLSVFSASLLTALQGPLSSTMLPSEIYEVAGLAAAALDPRTVQMKAITGSLLQKTLEISMRFDQVEAAKGALDCLASFAKGFMNDSCLDPLEVRAWFTEYSNGFLLNNLNRMPNDYLLTLINFTQRMIPLIQSDSVILIKEVCIKIITSNDCYDLELMSQLLPLISASLFKLKEQFACGQVLGQLWPQLIPRVKNLMCQPIQGTDDLLQHLTLQKAFLSLLHAMSTSGAGAQYSLALRLPFIEEMLLRIAEGFGGAVASADAIGLLRSFCGVINRCQSYLSREFINLTVVPVLLHKSLPEIYKNLDSSSKKSVASLPAAFLNLLQDFLQMMRSLHQNGNLSGELVKWNGIDLIGGEIKESRSFLVNYFLKVC